MVQYLAEKERKKTVSEKENLLSDNKKSTSNRGTFLLIFG